MCENFTVLHLLMSSKNGQFKNPYVSYTNQSESVQLNLKPVIIWLTQPKTHSCLPLAIWIFLRCRRYKFSRVCPRTYTFFTRWHVLPRLIATGLHYFAWREFLTGLQHSQFVGGSFYSKGIVRQLFTLLFQLSARISTIFIYRIWFQLCCSYTFKLVPRSQCPVLLTVVWPVSPRNRFVSWSWWILLQFFFNQFAGNPLTY